MITDQYKMRILVVDDNANALTLIRTILENRYTVIEAASGKEAMDILLKEDPPDLILLDIMMPDMDGFEVYEAIRSQNRLANIPVIFVTALDDRIAEQKGLKYGAVDYITKPFEKEILLVRIEAAIEIYAIFSRSNDDLLVLEPLYDELGQVGPPLPAEKPLPERLATVLSIDDEKVIRTFIDSGLKDDYQVVSCEDSKKAFEYLTDHDHPDLILLDISMPEMDGFETIQQLKASEATADIPVIFLTSQNSTEDEIKAFQAGAVDFVHKPISLPVLKARIRNQLLLDWKRKQLEARMEPFIDD